jgi:hypothetical protein
LVVTASVIAIGVAVVVYGLVFAKQNALIAHRRTCIQSRTTSADIATNDEAMKKIARYCDARFPG